MTRRTTTPLLAAVAALVLAACGTATDPVTRTDAAASRSPGAASSSAAPPSPGSPSAADPATSSSVPEVSATPTGSPSASGAASRPAAGPTASAGSQPSSRPTAPAAKAPTPKASTTKPSPSTPATPKPGPSTGSQTPTAPSSPRIVVSRTSGLNPAGATLTVTGSGFDPAIGIYVAVCTSAAPVSGSACVGGADLSGASGSSAWVSSNPPPYGVGLATPFGAGGTFRVTITVPASQGSLDCRTTTCGVITRADHTRYGERSQDTFVRISFA